MGYVVRTEVFEGPFDLLLHLIARQRVDLWQVSLARITEDYLAEVRRMRELNLEVATEFLVVAATLLELKAARLLPAPDEDPDEALALLEERDLLFARLLQYRAYKEVAALLGERVAAQAAYAPRQVGASDVLGEVATDLLRGVEPGDLARLAAAAFTPAPPSRVETNHLAPPKLSVAETVVAVARRLAAANGGAFSFRDLAGEGALPIEVVVSFLAVLELYKRELVRIDQASNFGDISIRWCGGDDPDLSDLPEDL